MHSKHLKSYECRIHPDVGAREHSGSLGTDPGSPDAQAGGADPRNASFAHFGDLYCAALLLSVI